MVIRWAPVSAKPLRFGLSVSMMRRNPVLFLFKDQIVSGTVGHQRRGTLATTILATGTRKVGKGKKVKHKPIKVRVTDKKGQQRYGWIERKITLPGNVESASKARTLAKRSLAKGLKPIRIVENMSHPGVATLRRGDAIRLSLPEHGFKGNAGIVFVTSVSHTLEAGSYSMSMSLGFIDPLDPDKLRKAREAALRASKRAKNKGGGVTGSVFNEGDSLAVGSAGALAGLLKAKLTTDAAVGRSSSAGVAQLKRRKLPDTLIVQLGTNDSSVSGFRASVNSVLALPGVSQVYWVNVKRPPLGGTSDSELNAVLDDIAGSNSKLVVIDWKGFVESEGITLDSAQHIHPTGAGYKKRAQLIARALN
jgi:lysophospholipase L1-like esterase